MSNQPMITPDESARQRQIAAVAQEMLSGTVDLVGGSRRLLALYHRLEEFDAENDQLFLPIVAFESETDVLPVGEARELWAPDALLSKEREFAPYLEKARPEILETCRALVRKYSQA